MDKLINSYEELVDQDTKSYKSACGTCHGGCGVLIEIKDRNITKIVGDPPNLMNKGKLCALGTASLEEVYNPRRLKYKIGLN